MWEMQRKDSQRSESNHEVSMNSGGSFTIFVV
jgi:hypothetical protein